MMYLPDFLYYTQTQSRIQYTNRVTHAWDPNRQLLGLPAWILPTASELKPKKIIFSDWTAKNWSPSKTAKVQALLGQLMDSGFSIYIGWGKSIEGIKKNGLIALEDKRVKAFMKPCHPEKLIKTAQSQLKLTKDELFILDDYWLDYLLEEKKKSAPRVLKISDYLKLTAKKRDKLSGLLKQSYPRLDCIQADEFTESAVTELRKLRKDFPNTEMNLDIQTVVLTPALLGDLQNKLFKDKTGNPLNLKDFSSTRHMALNDLHLKEGEFEQWVYQAEGLEDIYLKQCTLPSKIAVPQDTLRNLQSISLYENNLSMEHLNTLLHSSKNIRVLYLTQSNFIDGHLKLAEGSLLRLKHLILSNTLLSIDNLKTLIRAAPNLIELSFYSSAISTKSLMDLIQPLSQLKILKLVNCQQLKENFNFPEDSLPNLEEIVFIYSDLTKESLHNLFLAAKNLKKIDLWKREDQKVELNFPPHTLNSLEIIKFGKHNIATEKIQTILQSASHLKKITIQNFIDDKPLVLEADSLLTLEKISMSRAISLTKVDEDNLKSLLKAAKNLKVLNLEYIRIDPEFQSWLLNYSSNHPHLAILWTHIGGPPSTSPADSKHEPQALQEFKPKEEEAFVYQRKNKTKNQGMVIEQISQYLSLQNKHLDWISKIQDGICLCLSQFCIQKGFQTLDSLLESFQNWDGNKEHLSPKLVEEFESLLPYIENLQFSKKEESNYYVGSHLSQSLASTNSPILLSNPWHAIAVSPIKENTWMVYDPNFVNGFKLVNGLEILEQRIADSLGRLVFINQKPEFKARIQNPSLFLEEGGLLALIKASPEQELLTQLPETMDYELKTLDGILLRNVQGIPAWVLGLQSTNQGIQALSKNLLNQFIKKSPNYGQALRKSMDAMSLSDKNTFLNSLSPEFQILLAKLRPASVKDYEKQLETWNKAVTTLEPLDAYCQQICAPSMIKKRLIQFSCASDLKGLRFALERHAASTHRPLFYVHAPEDLVCNAPYIQREGNKGMIKNGDPGGGKLYDFLKANADKDPILVVNYDNFKPEDIVHFNALLDKKRLIDKTALPEETLVLGLINLNKPDCYQGSDFYSRFDLQEAAPVSPEDLQSALIELPLLPNLINEVNGINLFHASDWKEQLLGRWLPDGTGLHFEEGVLADCLKKGPIEIYNGLWEQEEFTLFWQEAILRGKIEYAGRSIEIPKDLVIIPLEGYDWTKLSSRLQPASNNIPPEALNPSRLNEFFDHLAFDPESHAIKKTIGLIEAHRGQSLAVYLTRDINQDEWARVLTECERYNVVLNLSLAPNVNLPQKLDFKRPSQSLSEERKENSFPQVFISSDVDATTTLLQQDSDWQFIDVSECTPADLLERLDGSFNPNTLSFEYQYTVSALMDALSKGKRIILKGTFSKELADQLAPLLLERQRVGAFAKGQLVLVTDDPDSFQYVAEDVIKHQVSLEDKKAGLGPLSSELEACLSPYMNEPLYKLKARRVFYETNPYSLSSDNAWLGLYTCPKNTRELEPFNPSTSLSDAQEFKQYRRSLIDEQLKHAPFIFIAGLSGVGKTSFVNKHLCQGQDILYQEGAIKEWLEDKCVGGRKILFIDEATLEPSDWTLFEGLFQDKPSILYQGKLYDLSKEHRIVFAGNPLSYGDERKLATLFKHHGNTVIFDPIPTAVLYEDILKPVFANTVLEKNQEAISAHFFKVYQFLVECAKFDVLISPRELQMMALMTVSYCKNNPQSDPLQAAEQFAFTIAQPLVPSDRKEEFCNSFKPEPLYEVSKVRKLSDDFMLTPSRFPIYRYLSDLLNLRKDRLKNAAEANEAQLYGGLGGLILEGGPGIGKTELVIETLIANGYEEMPHLELPSISLHPFYRLPVSLDQDKKEALLAKAFHEGAVVIIDEINSSPCMERLVNELLMGTLNGERPKNPGFMIIGTQNPVSMAGRRIQSTALSRRLSRFELDNYPNEEMKDILSLKGLDQEDAKTMVTALNNTISKAKANYWSPLPTFRDLIRVAENAIKSLGFIRPVLEAKNPKKKWHSIFFSEKKDRLATDNGPRSQNAFN